MRPWEHALFKWVLILLHSTISQASLFWMLFSPGGTVFKLAESMWSIRHRCPLLTLVIRAKKNCVAYFEAKVPEKKLRGRPRKYGEKIKVSELFDYQDWFEKVECTIYGRVEMASIAVVDLLWKPAGGLIRFALAVNER